MTKLADVRGCMDQMAASVRILLLLMPAAPGTSVHTCSAYMRMKAAKSMKSPNGS